SSSIACSPPPRRGGASAERSERAWFRPVGFRSLGPRLKVTGHRDSAQDGTTPSPARSRVGQEFSSRKRCSPAEVSWQLMCHRVKARNLWSWTSLPQGRFHRV